MDSEIVAQLYEIEKWFVENQVGNKELYLVAFFIFSALLIVLIAKKYNIPIVVGYVFLGILLSIEVINILPFLTLAQKVWYAYIINSFQYVTQLALGFIAFTIGSELSIKLFKKLGKSITYIVLIQGLGAFLMVFLGVLIIGYELYLALILGAIASATAPAATVMVIREYNAEGPVTSMIMAVVGLDDALALILFSLIKPVAYNQYSGNINFNINHMLFAPVIEVLGSILVGIVIGYLSVKLMEGSEDKTKKILTLITTIVSGLSAAIFFELSPLITNMTIGFAYRNFSRKNLNIADYIDTLTIPLYAMFFILAGTEIRFSVVNPSFILLALVYTAMRVIGKIGGTSIGAILSNASDNIKKYVGLGLLPQSGVAIALAYTVQKEFSREPHIGLLVFNVLLFTAALTEIIGSFATKYALTKSDEINKSQNS
ncbi:MAG: cation:proton antiporter [Halanaerobiales bacterium]